MSVCFSVCVCVCVAVCKFTWGFAHARAWRSCTHAQACHWKKVKRNAFVLAGRRLRVSRCRRRGLAGIPA